jgi:uncharacterized lipoprotein YajG
MTARIFVFLAVLFLAGCADDPQSCKQAGGTWDGALCTLR